MGPNPLDVLKEGLSKLQAEIQGRKNDLLVRLHRNEKISEGGGHWLDQDANLVDEEALIGVLEKASDYKSKLTSFDSDVQKRLLIQKLMAAVNLTGEVIRQKWTHFADIEGIPDDERLQFSEGWLTAFRR